MSKLKQKQAEQTYNSEISAEGVISMRDLLEAGVHFGHQTKRWNPKMAPYIFTARNGIHVIDLQKSIPLINQAYAFVKDTVKKGNSILFVGTKKQAQEAIKTEALRAGMPFINNRWLGGFLTNNQTIHSSINKLKKLKKQQDDGSMDRLSKKEASQLNKKYTRLSNYLGGVKDMVAMPAALFIVDTNKEYLAIQEAKKKGIKIIGVVDTNANPQDIDFPIPANDDAIRAIKLICELFANAVIDGQKEQVSFAQSQKSQQA